MRQFGLILCFALLGCPGDEPPVADAGPAGPSVHGRPGETPLAVPDEVPLAELCTFLTESYCNFVSKCDPTAPYLRVESCRQDELLPIHNCLTHIQYPIQTRVEAGTVTYRGDRVTACLRSFDLQTCSGFVGNPACELAQFTDGQQPRGGCCYDSSECADSVCRDRGPNAEIDRQGRCGSPFGDGAGRCFSAQDCAEGLVCDRNTCRTPVPEDSNCSHRGVPCAAGLFCAGEVGDETCQPAVRKGMRCGFDNTLFAPCLEGMTCFPEAGRNYGVCGPHLAVGEPCDGTIPCSPGLRCSSPNGPSRYECTVVTFGDIGDECEVGHGTRRCNSRTTCRTAEGQDSGTCEPFPDLGEACDGRVPCRTGWCRPAGCDDVQNGCRIGRAGLCAPFLEAAAACGDTRQCGPAEGGRFCSSERICAGESVPLCDN
jgi:hypothetical protein